VPVPPDGTTYTHTVPGPGTSDPHPYSRLDVPHSGQGWQDVLELALGAPMGLDVTKERCFLVVMGNVQVKQINKGNTTNNNNVLATFALGYKLRNAETLAVVPNQPAVYPETFFVPQETICHAVNSNMAIWDPATGLKNKVFEDYPLHTDVPLMWVIDMTTRSSASVPGNYITQPPATGSGTRLDFKSISILASVTPKGGDKNHITIDGVPTPAGTEGASVSLNRANLSAFLLRY
jgi:hypothetical protein